MKASELFFSSLRSDEVILYLPEILTMFIFYPVTPIPCVLATFTTLQLGLITETAVPRSSQFLCLDATVFFS